MTMIPLSLRKEMEAAAKLRTPTSRQYRCRRDWPRWGYIASLAGAVGLAAWCWL